MTVTATCLCTRWSKYLIKKPYSHSNYGITEHLQATKTIISFILSEVFQQKCKKEANKKTESISGPMSLENQCNHKGVLKISKMHNGCFGSIFSISTTTICNIYEQPLLLNVLK